MTEVYGGGGRRPWFRSMMRGANRKCPRCDKGPLFRGYTKTLDQCEFCGLEISGHRADDAPPYLTIMIVGHITIPFALAVKQIFDPPLGLQYAIWLPIAITASAWLLPITKGGMIGLQWANRMHGFGEVDAE